MTIEQMVKSGVEGAAFAGALWMLVFWSEIVAGLAG